MSQTKTARIRKRQLGQFYTPTAVARRLVEDIPLGPQTTVLEPSAGDGAFVLPLIERFMRLYDGPESNRLRRVLNENVFAIEIDPEAHAAMLASIEREWGPLPTTHNLVCGDYFDTDFEGPPSGGSLFAEPRRFDVIIGNPPFGGTIEPRLQDLLDGRYGERGGFKIKKETYSFFIVRSVELLRPDGSLRFICSDTFLTIPTMKGLREFLLNRGSVSVTSANGDFEETSQPMVVLDFERGGHSERVEIDGRLLRRETINLTGNRSWQITESLGPLFSGSKLGDFMVASSGMTIGKNELFVRDIVDGQVTEPFDFKFREEPITLKRELERARLGHLSDSRIAEIMRQERAGATRRNVEVVPLDAPTSLQLPHRDYCYYNKACGDIVYAPPKWAVFWRDDGDAVKTFKKNGNWYLYGVGGQPYFKREGLSWQLISPTLNARYLPAGYILDSGAPCAFLRDGIGPDELWFILGWCLTPLCTQVLKDVLNHTRNIQSKDFERLPYPYWVDPGKKREVVARCKDLVATALRSGRSFKRSDIEVSQLTACYGAGLPSQVVESTHAVIAR
jgi:hypothetical protein